MRVAEEGSRAAPAAASDLHAALAGLARKYALETPRPWRLIDGGETGNDAEDGTWTLNLCWSCSDGELGDRMVPLLPWRSERRFLELKRIVQERTIDPVLMCRFACLTDGRTMPLAAVLYRELDLVEWLSGQPIASVYASIHGGSANVILRLAGGIIGSVEAGTSLPAGSPVQDRHELIARRGVACDRAVDTQVAQDSVYAFTESGSRQYTDTDAELFGLSAQDVALVRAGYEALCRSEEHEALRRRHRRLVGLVRLVLESDRKRQRLAAEGGLS